MDEFKVYAIRSKDGKWFRRKGCGGYGDSWVEELSKARIYNKSGPARAQSSWWFINYPQYGCPEVIVFTAKITEVINNEEQAQKRLEKKQKIRM